MAIKTEKSKNLTFLIEEIDEEACSGTLEKDYHSILECGREAGISSYITNLLAKAAVRNHELSPEIEYPVIPASFVYTHVPQKEQGTIESLENEIRNLKENPVSKKSYTERTVLLLFVLGIIFLGVVGHLTTENSRLNDDKITLSKKLDKIRQIGFIAGSSKRLADPSTDSTWVEWFDVKYPVRIESFYMYASQSGEVTVAAYDTLNNKVTKHKFYVQKGGWSKYLCRDFDLPKGKYYIGVENTSVRFGYHSSNAEEYSQYKQGALQVIGTTSRDKAKSICKDTTAIINNISQSYYQYFYSIQYSLL